MKPKLFLLFNHQITEEQRKDAALSLAVASIIEPPEAIRDVWKRIPPELSAIDEHLAPVKSWISEQAGSGDYLLVQGDFGATYLMVCYAFENDLIPIYSTTERLVVEAKQADGAVRLTHTFRHCRFRRYGE